MEKQVYRNMDEYIALQPTELRPGLEKLRALVLKAVPDAEEVISYNMPGFKWKGKILVWFAGTKNHYGFYPYPETINSFSAELKGYDLSKGTVRFPLDKSLPVKLITDMVKYRKQRILDKLIVKPSSKKKK